MEFSERKRSRKSQSFKLVNRDYHHEVYKISDLSSDVNGEAKETQHIFLGDESMEIKKQITGMRRLLNDSAGRIYQRVGKEGEKLKEEPQDLDAIWPQRLNSAEAPPSLHPSSRGAWNELPPQSGQFSGQYGTRSRTFQSQPHTAGSSNGELPVVNSSAGSNCCTCNCQSTLQAILQELKTMRKLMQIQAEPTFLLASLTNAFWLILLSPSVHVLRVLHKCQLIKLRNNYTRRWAEPFGSSL